MPPGLRRRSRKSNNDDPSSSSSTTRIDGSITIASTTDDSNMKPQLKEKENHHLLRSRSAMKHLTLKRLKSNPTKSTTTTATSTSNTTAKASLPSSSFSSSPLDTTQLEIIMHNDASEDFNDLKSLLTENDSTHYNHDHNNKNNTNNNNHLSTAPSKKEDESKIKRMATRLISGLLMVGTFVGTMYLGHIYMCTLIFLVEVALFRDLVRARYNTFFHRIEETIPLFRTTQWMWFITAIFYTYSDFAMDFLKSNTSLHYLLEYAYAWTIPGFAFLLYSGTFVLTIATMQRDHIRFQLNQLCWTILVLCLTVGQLKYIMHNVYNGLIWFGLPIMLVVSNDSFAWLFGVLCGRKFIHRDFISLSPNKTWEGFIGGWIGTMFMAWHLSRFMARFKWMTCPEKSISLWTKELDCQLDPIFEPATNIVPSQVFELFPRALMKMIPGIVDICMVNSDPNVLTPCVSGEESHSHHHFELYLKNLYPVQIHALGLSLFASFVAPFGGFLASGIKRAYGLKDFGNYIPGHGGMMDRMDCQFLMALCVWVHYNTFVKMATVSVPKVFYFYKLMKDSEKEEFLMLVKQLENET